MLVSNDFNPDWVSPPGDTIIDLMDEVGLSIEELSKQIGLPKSKGQSLIEGELDIGDQLASRLEATFDVSKKFWLSRENAYRKHIVKQEEINRTWLDSLPVRDMSKYGWIPKGLTGKKKLMECLNFFGVGSVSEWLSVYENRSLPVAFRKTASFPTAPLAELAWLRRAEIISSKNRCYDWDRDLLIDSLNDIRCLSVLPDPRVFLPKLRSILAACGVSLVILQTPQGCRASGATCFFEKDKATLIMSFRYLQDDHFWFTLFHEIGHLILHEKEIVRLEGSESDDSSRIEEDEANEFARNVLIPKEYQSQMKYFSLRNWREIVRFSKRIGISKGIVLGQLQHMKLIPFSHLNRLKVKYNREHLGG
ncbi:ImmA/IrrE family metallo-endopeptidase [Vibrio cholerae]|uniref:ImmA/IrrE family metallo-endopeptidase n=1 Tax=Vibrio cholerae TaxID=666 RepID=UPI0021D07211|nr:ImmA/IrrE family metallo-endopeptidase [Vibrio cholerae]MCU4218299.1 ImmA/IrrE family metallo-endopeptidase [Vibrio cholerae]HCZ9559235.1 ImmA/IrrE family metallo-endopeptidase [Vibrio cholerae]HCZ9562762.1 ImmA/IrrE family metallo-endopeptidase [Vibrio cholerae]HCZ9572905.1 ImmA/IrrE family metallo-endopeptidase [Vibrio cholerae]HCZ9574058.1 ImmA/IrrE family metallo-endopeptidase [Vibrio cholerae]